MPVPTGSFPIETHLAPAVINFTVTGDNTVVAAVASQTIRVFRIVLVASAATNITFKDGTTALTGAMALAANGQIILLLDPSRTPWFVTSSGNAFVINQSGTAQISGKLDYTQS